MKEKKKLLTEQEREEMYQEFEKARPGKEARAFHKKYKAYGWGLCFHDRYPNFALVFSIVCLVLQILIPFLKAFIEIAYQ